MSRSFFLVLKLNVHPLCQLKIKLYMWQTLEEKKKNVLTKKIWWETLTIWTVWFLSWYELNLASDMSFLKLLVNTNNFEIRVRLRQLFIFGSQIFLKSVGHCRIKNYLSVLGLIGQDRKQMAPKCVIKNQNIFGVEYQ